MDQNKFRAELLKLMPGYKWTVHKTNTNGYLEATGIQSSGSNRLSTLSVIRREINATVRYEAKSAGFGTKAKWLHTADGKTLAQALRELQNHYEHMCNLYRAHAERLKEGRLP